MFLTNTGPKLSIAVVEKARLSFNLSSCSGGDYG